MSAFSSPILFVTNCTISAPSPSVGQAGGGCSGAVETTVSAWRVASGVACVGKAVIVASVGTLVCDRPSSSGSSLTTALLKSARNRQ